jgi:secreted PhoX family phosphatase
MATGTLPAGVEFPLANTTDDTVRSLPELGSHVVAKWLDPLTAGEAATDPRYGANNDYIAYFGEGWDSDWADGVVGSAPQFNGSPTAGWIWSNHEYISNAQPTPTSAPTGQHLTLAKFLHDGGVLSNDVTSDIWSQADVDEYIRHYKTQIGASWFRVVQDPSTKIWSVDRSANNLRYNSTDATLSQVTGFTLHAPDHLDDGTALDPGMVVGTAANCSGGQTPWGTIFSGEENAQDYYGDLETAWTSDQQFVTGQGFDPGSNITPTFEASPASDYGQSSNLNEVHNRDIYGYISEFDAGAAANIAYTSANAGGDGMGHRKIGSMGRARWENATIVTDGAFKLIDGQPIVIYGGNDRRGGRIYKWASQMPYTAGMTRAEVRALLDEGTLYVAHFAGLDNTTGVTLLDTGQPPTEAAPGQGQWIEMSVTSVDAAPNADALGAPGTTVGQALQDVNWNNIGGFPTGNDARLALWTAATKIGVMELNRPENIEWNANDPNGTPRLYVAFTNHGRQVALDQNGVLFDPTQHETQSPTRPDPVGSIFAMQEADPVNPATSKTYAYFMVWQGTEGQGPLDAANPDNLLLDAQGGVWFGTDGNFGRNGTADGLYYLDLDPAHQSGQSGIVMTTFGQAFRVAAGPGDSEFTGPAFNTDMTTLFSNIQHPGESFDTDPSTWPPR